MTGPDAVRPCRVLWLWLTGGWRQGFTLGRCTWCQRFEMIVPGEVLCEECWVESK